MKKTTFGIMALGALLLSPIASAHTGGVAHTHNSLMEGLIHPFSGLDHLIVLFSLGVMAYYLKGKSKSAMMISTSVLVMLSGLFLGSLFSEPFFSTSIEILITASIFIAAISLWNQVKAGNSLAKSLLNIASVTFILFHGWAHGVEFQGSNLMLFALGMCVSSTIIMSVGYFIARFLPAKLLSKVAAVCGLIATFS